MKIKTYRKSEYIYSGHVVVTDDTGTVPRKGEMVEVVVGDESIVLRVEQVIYHSAAESQELFVKVFLQAITGEMGMETKQKALRMFGKPTEEVKP